MVAFLIKDNIIDHQERQAEAVTSFDLANEKEFPLVTLCWYEGDFLKYMAETCGHSTQTNQLNFLQILQSCLATNISIEALLYLNGWALIWNVDLMSAGWILTRPFDGSSDSSYFKTSVSGRWSMLIHPKLGPCYTFEINKSNAIKDIFFYPNFGE